MLKHSANLQGWIHSFSNLHDLQHTRKNSLHKKVTCHEKFDHNRNVRKLFLTYFLIWSLMNYSVPDFMILTSYITRMYSHDWCCVMYIHAKIILCMCPANSRWRYTVTLSLIGWSHAQNDSSLWFSKDNFCHKNLVSFIGNGEIRASEATQENIGKQFMSIHQEL